MIVYWIMNRNLIGLLMSINIIGMKSAAGKPQVSELKLNIFTAFLSPSVETPNNGKLNLRSINTSRTHASNA